MFLRSSRGYGVETRGGKPLRQVNRRMPSGGVPPAARRSTHPAIGAESDEIAEGSRR